MTAPSPVAWSSYLLIWRRNPYTGFSPHRFNIHDHYLQLRDCGHQSFDGTQVEPRLVNHPLLSHWTVGVQVRCVPHRQWWVHDLLSLDHIAQQVHSSSTHWGIVLQVLRLQYWLQGTIQHAFHSGWFPKESRDSWLIEL